MIESETLEHGSRYVRRPGVLEIDEVGGKNGVAVVPQAGGGAIEGTALCASGA